MLTLKSIVGVGTGSTTNFFIDELASIKHTFDAAVSSSDGSTERMRSLGIQVIDLNAAPQVDVYVDGADEVNPDKQLIKGGGAALTREKIVAAAADEFICIVDESKLVDKLGAYPLPVEVIPMARSLVARGLVGLGGHPVWREGTVTDNGNWILDVHELDISHPLDLESKINDLAGVVCNGLFAFQAATTVLVGSSDGGARALAWIARERIPADYARSFPGFNIWCGSNTCLSPCINATSLSLRENLKKSRFKRPTPCSAEMLPLRAATSSKILGLIAWPCAMNSSTLMDSGRRMLRCRLPSPMCPYQQTSKSG